MEKNSDIQHYQINPEQALEILSLQEMEWLIEQADGENHELLRRCILAILNTGSELDDGREILRAFQSFDVKFESEGRGLKIILTNPPENAFVDGVMIRGIRELLTAVIRDILYQQKNYQKSINHLIESNTISDDIFDQLRLAKTLNPSRRPNLVVCWGGHSISELEYKYTKTVGYELGLRGLDICTGCGPGAMKGPMKGATIAHAKQRASDLLYLGITEPGIIASEPPNPIVNQLVIMPDIEKRLEAFVRLSHGIIIFPGGAGTAEELLYLLGILLHPDNANLPFPIVLTGPEKSRNYFEQLDKFIRKTLGDDAADRYTIIVEDPVDTARTLNSGILALTKYRESHNDSYHFNWRLKIEEEWQKPFDPSHENMSKLNLQLDQPKHILAQNLRKAFSGIVAGNVKPDGIAQIEQQGPFVINAGMDLADSLTALLQSFVDDHRMMLPTPSKKYQPCFVVKKM
ncbi:MAG TPA: LOG family protein YgdH [Aeromonadales bacterium]|nr:LOG family protein YgdH [Aeromonadales bacterium]